MLQGITYWPWLGTLYLLILTYKDHKHNMNIDDRQNWFMMGATFTLMSHINRPLGYVLLLIGLTIFLNWFMNRYNLIGGADASSLTWIFYGFGLINQYYLLFYIIYFGIVSIFYMLLKKVGTWWLKIPKNTPTPFYIVILITYLTFNWIFKLY